MTLTGLKLASIVLWVAWLAIWAVTALWSKPTAWREPMASRLIHGLPLALAAYLLAVRRRLPEWLLLQLWPPHLGLGLLGLALVAAGLGFAVWARFHLGANWSGTVMLKDDHQLIRTGPYRQVRHPIYSGLLLALLGTALQFGEVRGFVAFVLALAALLYKSRIEETRMRASFPDYDAYARQTAALVPYLY